MRRWRVRANLRRLRSVEGMEGEALVAVLRLTTVGSHRGGGGRLAPLALGHRGGDLVVVDVRVPRRRDSAYADRCATSLVKPSARD